MGVPSPCHHSAAFGLRQGPRVALRSARSTEPGPSSQGLPGEGALLSPPHSGLETPTGISLGMEGNHCPGRTLHGGTAGERSPLPLVTRLRAGGDARGHSPLSRGPPGNSHPEGAPPQQLPKEEMESLDRRGTALPNPDPDAHVWGVVCRGVWGHCLPQCPHHPQNRTLEMQGQWRETQTAFTHQMQAAH